MSGEKNKQKQSKRAAKRAAVLGTERKIRIPYFTIMTCLALVLAGGGFLFMNSKSKNVPVITQIPPSTNAPSNYDEPSNTGVPSNTNESQDSNELQFTFPVNLFDDSKARHYEYKDNNATIRYFILKSSDGVIRAAFDTCDVCWRAGRGYFQSGDLMICKNCRRSFASVNINVLQGGCNPVPLNRNIEEGNVVIRVKDILNGKQYFSFFGLR